MIVLNEINVSRNSNEDAPVMKADQIREMRGRLKRRELEGGKSWGRKERVEKMRFGFCSSVYEPKICVFGVDNNKPRVVLHVRMLRLCFQSTSLYFGEKLSKRDAVKC